MSNKLKKNIAVTLKYTAPKSKCVSISYKFLCNDKQYTFEYFGKDVRKEVKARKELDKLLVEISKYDWVELGGRRKEQFGGYEQIPIKRCVSSIFKKVDPYIDDKVIVFRFCQGDYRLIGYRMPTDDTLYILGYDFNHSAYNHGA